MANLKISQVEKTTNMDADAYVLVVQNGKNYRMSIKEAIAANVDLGDVDLSNYYTKTETINIIKKNQEKKHFEEKKCIKVKTYDEPDQVYKEKEVLKMICLKIFILLI